MIDETNSSGVTLVVNDDSIVPAQSVCKFYQNGFCKFSQACCKIYVNQLCTTPNCNKQVCSKRHPKLCRYFSQNGHCKRGQKCAYKHLKSETCVKVEEIETEVNVLKTRPDLSVCKICNINFEDIEYVKNNMSDRHGLLVRYDS